MRFKTSLGWAACVIALSGLAVANGADRWGLKEGTPELASAGPLAFGPDGILIVGDTKGAQVFAIATGDDSGNPSEVKLNIEGLNAKVAAAVGAKSATINDLAVNPISGNVYLSVTKGSGDDASAAIVRIDAEGKLTDVSLKKVAYSKATLPDAPEDKEVGEGPRRRNLRSESITDLAFVDGKVIVSGATAGDSPSSVRELAFPPNEADQGTPIEIYHGAHGRYENYATVRVFVPFTIGGEPSLLAGFTCTPLVKFPLDAVSTGEKLRGTTVAELGNRNRPLDMIVYEQGGKTYLLMANSARGVMKISTEEIGRKEGITEPVRGGGTAGQTYETIEPWKGIVQLDKLNDKNAVVIVQTESGDLNLETRPLP